jgi:hypothetical protein
MPGWWREPNGQAAGSEQVAGRPVQPGSLECGRAKAARDSLRCLRIELAGGKIEPDELPGNPFHCLLSGISPEAACGLFTPTIPNPGR